MLGFVRKAVQNSVEKPNLFLALIFVLLPVLLLFFVQLFIGTKTNYLNLAMLFLLELAGLVLSSAGLYLLISFFKGKDVKGKLTGIITALSYTKLVQLVFLVIALGVIFLIAPKEFFPAIVGAQTATSAEEVAQAISTLEGITVQDESLFALGVGLILVLLVIAMLLTLYLFYSTIKTASKENPHRAFFVLVLFVIFQLILGFFL